MANARGKEIDNTHLSIDQAEKRGFLHRDYIAHCLRWTHVCNYLQQGQKYKGARVLDIGAGRDLPMAKMLYSSRLIVEDFVGLDYNSTDKFDLGPFHSGKMPVTAYGGVIFPQCLNLDLLDENAPTKYSIGTDDEYHGLPNVITCFEVLEHVEPAHSRAMLAGILKLLKLDPHARAFISTPCYDRHVGAADNHVSEITYMALGATIEDLGLEIEGHWGTFASQKDYKHHLLADYPDMNALWHKLSGYYDSNYIATLFAPLYPEHARNVLWQLRAPTGKDYEREFPKLLDLDGPWTSSSRWPELCGVPMGSKGESTSADYEAPVSADDGVDV